MRGLAAALAAEARRSDAVVLWLDCDREGEAICFEVLAACAKGKQAFNNYNGPLVRRAKFSSLVPRDLEAAVRALVAPDFLAAQAVLCRTELDLRVGAAFSRLQTMNMQTRVPALVAQGGKGVISYGPCQLYVHLPASLPLLCC